MRWPRPEGGDLDLEEARSWDKSLLFGKYLHLPPPPAPQLPTLRSILYISEKTFPIYTRNRPNTANIFVMHRSLNQNLL